MNIIGLRKRKPNGRAALHKCTAMKRNDFYTAGQLAQLFAIPKQTMEYYDKMGILKPAYIAENGYRYYATQQYLTLEIIVPAEDGYSRRQTSRPSWRINPTRKP